VTVSAPSGRFRITAGKPKLYVRTAENGRRRLQFFCANCGSPIYTTGEAEDARHVGIRLGTVNQRQELSLRSQIGVLPHCPGLKTFFRFSSETANSPVVERHLKPAFVHWRRAARDPWRP
jgi:hypothetical protein